MSAVAWKKLTCQERALHIHAIINIYVMERIMFLHSHSVLLTNCGDKWHTLNPDLRCSYCAYSPHTVGTVYQPHSHQCGFYHAPEHTLAFILIWRAYTDPIASPFSDHHIHVLKTVTEVAGLTCSSQHMCSPQAITMME